MEGVRDSYNTALDSILSGAENLLGLDQIYEQSDLKLRDKDIQTVLSEVIQRAQSLHKADSQQDLKELNTEMSKQLLLLPYTGQRMIYYKKVRLDFRVFPRVNDIAKVLIPFASREEEVTEDALRAMNRLIEILKATETKQVNARFSLAYRFVRLFLLVTLTSQGSYFSSSLVATFVLQQLAGGE